MNVLPQLSNDIMKLIRIILITLIVYLIAFGMAKAQDELLAIPLSNPGQPGELRVELVRGSITIRGYDGEEVVVQTAPTESNYVDDNQGRDGLRKISSGGNISMEAIEEDNRVTVRSRAPESSFDFDIQVPRNFSIKAKAVNEGMIFIENIDGEVEATNINDDVELQNIAGSAVVNTVNGEITVVFDEVTPDTPMSFTTLNGDIEVTFPTSTAMLAKMKTLNGEIFTDFDMDVKANNKREASNDGGIYRVKVDKEIMGTVNGGGPEIYFKSHNGDIIIRKK
ncbi:DUF4097 family beta strand repeat-containing protein [Tunicatimonas pelagia]|uniref:DUF4097 family beta strand repeat-containing protein n=1 Tax=Tunicatimonas pelagia TaxID=931531 RepID=UPI0026659ED6|nr:DUF4097 family beta strand repeat-containing protein [Tunicatimonas pelagia]WKN40927.1 DUF4097 family beta strand repeat-containing protein [Tunicatimonas pelagia]